MLVTILVITGLTVVMMWIVVGAMLVSGGISHHEDVQMGWISPAVDGLDFDAEPAVG